MNVIHENQDAREEEEQRQRSWTHKTSKMITQIPKWEFSHAYENKSKTNVEKKITKTLKNN